MKAGVASRTALGVARHRAAHQVLDDPVMFRDPLAETIIGGLESASRLTDARLSASRRMRAFVAARSRFAEDELTAFFARGICQYVVLGPGLDTFAYRNPYAPAVHVFEVDHPDTHTWKIERLKATSVTIPDSLRFVSVNFETEELARTLENAPGFDRRRRLFVEPQELGEMLRGLGFTALRDLGAAEISYRYSQDRTDGLKIEGALGRIVSPIVGPAEFAIRSRAG
jgi:O-methyltransferase involved in polyketide biosynthesis